MIVIAKDQVREPLHAVIPFFNPWRFKSRVKHAERAIKHFTDSGAVVTLVEAGYNRRELVFADSGLDGTVANCAIGGEHRHRYIGLHTKDELWLKENMINIGVQSLPHTWQQVCWLDADVHFARPNWVGEAIHKLQHYAFVQMFSQAQDLGPNYETLAADSREGIRSFVQAWTQGVLERPANHHRECRCRIICVCSGDSCRCKCVHDPRPPNYPPNVWPGLAWACTRAAWDAVGGLFDVAVWGGGDFDMAYALIEKASEQLHKTAHPHYQTMLAEWEDRSRWYIRRNIGMMEGVILHHWHGRKNKRAYTAKRRLMANTQFDPLRHLKRDSQGLYQLHDDGSENFIQFRDAMRLIAAARKEDSIDV